MFKKKVPKTLRHRLQNRDWAHQEIITEALVVLFIACQVSVKFGNRVFPEWGNSRVDPDAKSRLDWLLENFGYEMDGCIWDSIMAPWTSPKGLIILDTPSTSSSPNQLKAIFAYVATFATVCVTAILGMSLGCSLFINRRWQAPTWQYHLRCCGHITAFFCYNKNSRGYFENIVEPQASRWLFVGLHLVLLAANFMCFIWVWLVLCALPVVSIAALVFFAVAQIVGEGAVFPCCVILVILLALHCTGRIWGLWMTGCYLAWVNKKIRRYCGMELFTKTPIPDCLPDTMERNPDAPIDEIWKRRLLACFVSTLMLTYGCTAVQNNADLLLAKFPQANYVLSAFSGSDSGNWSYWTLVNCTGCCTNGGSGLSQSGAMLSYWTDLAYDQLHANSSNAALLAGFAPSLSPVVGWVFMAWTGLVAFLGALPLTLIWIVDIVGFSGIALFFIVYLCYKCCFASRHSRGTTENRHTSTGRAVQPHFDGALVNNDVEANERKEPLAAESSSLHSTSNKPFASAPCGPIFSAST
ncbi:uncharacterized protein LOC129596298 [Paramacrobiotus metropolitanus]|uniref:uncharacterized protein LOC129596298 n=1 Tax=Paramacrobiotus metropolitanus TaxID=2943436 RepID=UPI00244591D0|nr:uncharacterized protein LOC129596298 [Paramacrobiotus metropolitanus]XP_055349510.1 uncharacterized protein LOC129596298 [Paramacrobiotus metropolitanus]